MAKNFPNLVKVINHGEATRIKMDCQSNKIDFKTKKNY